MAEHTHIEWTDATWNPITGCTLVSEGCKHCYAATLAAGRLQHHPSRAGLARVNAAGEAKFTGEVRFNEQWLDQPLRWKRPRRIFVCAHSDLFHESVPDEWIDRVFVEMALAPRHTFQVLTKRPARMQAYISRFKPVIEIGARVLTSGLSFNRVVAQGVPTPSYVTRDGNQAHDRDKGSPLFRWKNWPLPNVWLGTSVEDQATADARIEHLRATPAAVRFISIEPMLGPVSLRWLCARPENAPATALKPGGVTNHLDGLRCLDWVIVGGESGPGARPMNPDWARALRDQCQAAGVAFFMKQMSKKAPIPADLMVRGFPQ